MLSSPCFFLTSEHRRLLHEIGVYSKGARRYVVVYVAAGKFGPAFPSTAERSRDRNYRVTREQRGTWDRGQGMALDRGIIAGLEDAAWSDPHCRASPTVRRRSLVPHLLQICRVVLFKGRASLCRVAFQAMLSRRFRSRDLPDTTTVFVHEAGTVQGQTLPSLKKV
jgi:hypothetical protein